MNNKKVKEFAESLKDAFAPLMETLKEAFRNLLEAARESGLAELVHAAYLSRSISNHPGQERLEYGYATMTWVGEGVYRLETDGPKGFSWRMEVTE